MAKCGQKDTTHKTTPFWIRPIYINDLGEISRFAPGLPAVSAYTGRFVPPAGLPFLTFQDGWESSRISYERRLPNPLKFQRDRRDCFQSAAADHSSHRDLITGGSDGGLRLMARSVRSERQPAASMRSASSFSLSPMPISPCSAALA
jgi:hypothetical protein